MKTGGRKDIGPKYNCQAEVTGEGVITAGEAVEECNDRHQLEPMIEKSESNTEKKVDEVGADSGYASYENYEYLERRELLVDLREPLLVAMREKLMSEEGALKYFMRQYIIEPIFGHLKHNLGYKTFLLRGLDKVNAEFKLMCIGWNIKKLLKLGFTPSMVKNL